MDIRGKVALVTGGTDGIGLCIARLLKEKGATVIVCGRRAERLTAARAEGFEAIEADLSSLEGVSRLAQDMKSRPLDILINNAGAGVDFDLTESIDLDAVDRNIFLNLDAPIRLAAELVPHMKARPKATLVNVTSGLAIAPRSGGPVYCATKAGLRSFTKAIRFQLRGTNITVIEALPPVVETAMTAARTGSKMKPEKCAAAIVSAIERDRIEANIGMVRLLKLVHSISPRLAEAIMIRF
ncbi:MAG: SDR family NAD(P)-dependent oxidoreductase [Rhodocyclaceae bacterium]|nr:MAG: SDR family NAD(P)-dependent oxidoreductase [Rhodocyclaceae bacterium]